MEKQINFIIPAPYEYLSLYKKVILSIIDPIRIHLPKSIISHNSICDGVNIHFFNEPAYRGEKAKKSEGIHVFMSHGMGDKKWRDGSKVKSFDYVCVSGPSWIEKMIRQGIPSKQVLLAGFPKLDPLFQGIIKKTGGKKITVLYAPTHVGSAPCTSYPAFMEFLEEFPKDLQIIYSIHPYHKEANTPVFQELAEADVVISDGSSVIFEALALGIPVIFPDWLVKDAILTKWGDTFTADIYRERIGYHADSFEHLVSLIYDAKDKRLTDKDKTFIDGILPKNLRGNSGKATAGVLKKLIKIGE